jgi:hypothetical protein
MEPRQPLGDRRHGILATLLTGVDARRELAAHRLEPLGEALDQALRVEARHPALDLAELGLERRQPREDGLDGGLLLGVEPCQPLGELGERCGALGGAGLGGLERSKPVAQPVEERAGLGHVADRLERLQPGAQLVEAGERGLERGVLVAHEVEQRARHSLQLLGAAGLGELGEPLGEVGLDRLDLLHAPLESPRHGIAVRIADGGGGGWRTHGGRWGGHSLPRTAGALGPAARGQRPVPPPAGEPPGGEEEQNGAERPSHRRTDLLHAFGLRPRCAWFTNRVRLWD